MELVILFVIAAVLIFAPRRGGRMLARHSPQGEGGPSKDAIILGVFFLLWFLVTMSFGTLWNKVFGTIPQP